MHEGSNHPGLVVDLPDPEATTRFGHALGKLLQPGDVLALLGPLGAGKTHLVRAVAEGMGLLDGQRVCSPTFVLLHVYSARLPIFHFDAYRLHNTQEFEDLGVGEYLEGDGVCLIEWADRVTACLPVDRFQLGLTVTGSRSRQILLLGTGPRCRARIDQWKTNPFGGS